MTADFGASDRITDFVHGSDRLELDDIGSIVHQIDANSFSSVASGHAGDADDLFVYDRATGLLWFDTNGNTAGGQIVLVELSSKPQTLSATDLRYV